jgi:uncharacterized SAM-binding protein YcdF (DUF218 family)
LRPLESQYAFISSSNLHKEVRWIVVLGGGSRENNALTPEDRLNDATLKRLQERVRFSCLLPNARLVLSGGDYQGISPNAVMMQQVALDQGVAGERILLDAASRDAMEQAKFLKDHLGKIPFYLITSASHMPRAMQVFSPSGTQPIAELDTHNFTRHACLSRLWTYFRRPRLWPIRKGPFMNTLDFWGA